MQKMSANFYKSCFRFLRKVGLFGYSKKSNIYGINPFLVSLCYILLTLVLATILRKLVKLFMKQESTLRYILFEFIATLELCAACFELIIVADNWGVTAYAVSLFLLTIWWCIQWEDASACPYCPMEEIVGGTRNLQTALYIICAQLIAAFCTFRYVQILWSLELVETHKGKAFEECTADLQVDMIVGAFIECVFTCLCRVVSRVLSEKQTRFGNILDALFSTAMVVLAFNFSGGYFNPALATSLKFGCTGNTFVEHIVVYWVGSCIGSIISIFVCKLNVIQDYCKKPKIE